MKYVLSAQELREEVLQLKGMADGVWVYENATAVPRAFLVHHIQEVEEAALLPTLLDPVFNWRQSGLVTESLPDVQQGQLTSSPIPTTGEVVISAYGYHDVTVEVETAVAGMLLLSDAYYPGWQATLNGEVVTIERVNGVMRGVFVPPGKHEVQFRFRPVVLQQAFFLAGFSLLAMIVLVIIDKRSRREH